MRLRFEGDESPDESDVSELWYAEARCAACFASICANASDAISVRLECEGTRARSCSGRRTLSRRARSRSEALPPLPLAGFPLRSESTKSRGETTGMAPAPGPAAARDGVDGRLVGEGVEVDAMAATAGGRSGSAASGIESEDVAEAANDRSRSSSIW